MHDTGPALTNKLALITGMLGALAVVALTVVGGANFPNYSHASQFISELGADGAPNARLIMRDARCEMRNLAPGRCPGLASRAPLVRKPAADAARLKPWQPNPRLLTITSLR